MALIRSDVLGIFRVGFDEFPDVLRGRADTVIGGQMLRDLARTLTAVPGFQDLIPERHLLRPLPCFSLVSGRRENPLMANNCSGL